MKRFTRFIVAASIVFFAGAGAGAGAGAVAWGREEYAWKSVRVGGGGFVPGIVFSRVEQGLAYLRSDMGGAYRWDLKAESWVPLQDGMGGQGKIGGREASSYQGIESIAPDPRDAEVVYMAAGMYRGEPSAMLRSGDRGRNWEVYPVGFRMGGNEDGRGVGERLAVDPNDTDVLYFGSRHDGLQVSVDKAKTWRRVESFPASSSTSPTSPRAGVSFVVFDQSSGKAGERTRVIYVGVTDGAGKHLFRTADAGTTWESVPGQPGGDMLPAKAEMDGAGMLYVTYSNGVGPNGVTAGAVWKLSTAAGHETEKWTEITPGRGGRAWSGGFMGLSVDRAHPGTLAVATMNRWQPGDTVYRSADGGASWHDILGKSRRDVRGLPWLLWGDKEARLGWWMAGLAIDPFDSEFAAYATGATIYATREFSKVSMGQESVWRPWVEGIEQTAVITLASPAIGPHLVSGFGDIGGFAHDDLDVSPGAISGNPIFTNTTSIDVAGMDARRVVRSGTPKGEGGTLAISGDGGETWVPMAVQAMEGGSPAGGRRRRGEGTVAISADGGTVVVNRQPPILTRDEGKSWKAVEGVPVGARLVADRVDGKVFYGLDGASGDVLVSVDGGERFERVKGGLPVGGGGGGGGGGGWVSGVLKATPRVRGDVWWVGNGRLMHSGGSAGVAGAGAGGVPLAAGFEEVAGSGKGGGGLRFAAVAFGMAAPGRDYPALFALASEQGVLGGGLGVYRSDNAGSSWVRINDEAHQYGTRFRCIEGDPRVFGRVYVGTDGRGILYGSLK